jgi:hypothetical protein
LFSQLVAAEDLLSGYLGHRNIQHTVRYTELAPTRFKNLWHDWPAPLDLCS